MLPNVIIGVRIIEVEVSVFAVGGMLVRDALIARSADLHHTCKARPFTIHVTWLGTLVGCQPVLRS